jgi:3-deoxy-D-manno-octulosonic-acid transferase
MIEGLYRVATRLLGPQYLKHVLKERVLAGKEEAARLNERYGKAVVQRPSGPLLWIHAASVGESLSMIELIKRLKHLYPSLTILMTTQTITSAALVKQRLNDQVIHQFLPYDIPSWVEAFLDHWRPNHVLWVESELWPNLLSSIKARRIGLTLVNGRMSDKSYGRWKVLRYFISPPLRHFDACLVQSDEQKNRFEFLGASSVQALGNIKYAAAPLPFDEEALAHLKKAIGNRPVWVAASTHAGEESFIIEAHERLLNEFPTLLTILIPRHPHRGEQLQQMFQDRLPLQRRSRGALIDATTGIYLADTLGELGLFYRLSPIAFVGGSFVPIGGHNIIEPAQLGAAIIHGPFMHNFREVREVFAKAEAHMEVADTNALVNALTILLNDPKVLAQKQENAQRIAQQQQYMLDQVMETLQNIFETKIEGLCRVETT